MTKDRNKLLTFIIKNRAYLLSFFAPAVLLYISYAIFGVYPFGEHSVLALDLNAQYVSYFDYMYDVLAGRESIFYCWSKSLSGEFVGTFAYYLASPFNFIIWLFPRKNITEGILAMLLAKCATTGLSSCIFLRKQRNVSEFTAVLFSGMYALSGYFTAHTLNPMWLDGMIALPLVLMGVERIFREKRFTLYFFSLVYVFVSNYYIGYMVGIFSAIYFFYRLILEKEKTLRNAFSWIFMYGISSVSAILISCPIIIPVYKSLKLGKVTYGDRNFTLEENFNLSDSLIKLFPAAYDTIRPEGLPMIYAGTLTVIMLAMYFLTKKFSVTERISSGMLLGVLMLSMYVKPVDMIWHGFAVPVWMPYRYAFIFTFLVIVFGASAFEEFRNSAKYSAKKIAPIFAVILGILLMLDHITGNDYFDPELIIVIPLLFTAAICVILFTFSKENFTKPACIILAVTVAGELTVNNISTFNKAHSDVCYSTRESYVGDIPKTRMVMDKLRETDGGFYRSEKTYHRTVNDPMALEMYGLSHSTSTFNKRVLELFSTLGIGSRSHYTRSDGMTELFDDIFGIKYVLSKYPNLTPHEQAVFTENEITVYENPDALPIAYLADIAAVGGGIYGENPFETQASLARLLADTTADYFHPIEEMIFDCENITIGTTTDDHASYKKRNSDEDAWLKYTITMPKSGTAYMFLPTYYERECGLYVDGNYVKNYFENENYSIAYLGNFPAGRDVEVSLKLNGDSAYVKETLFMYLDSDELAEFSEIMYRKNENTTVEKISPTKLKISVTAQEESALFTTIPFEEGWTLKIDDIPTEIKPCVNGTLMSAVVPAGTHEITLSFFPAGLSAGIVCGIFGVVIMVLTVIFRRIIKEKDQINDDGFWSDFDNSDK